MSFISPSSACIIECKLTLLFESFGSELEVTTAFRSVVYVRALVTRDTCKGNSSCRSFPIKKSTPCGKFSTRPHKIVPDNLSDSILTSTSGTSVGCPKIPWISQYSSVSTYSPAARHFFDTSDCKAPESRSKTTGRREPLFVHKVALTQNGATFCVPNPDFLGTIANLGVLLPEQLFLAPHQMQCFAFGSVGAQTVSLPNIPKLCDRLGHTLCKGLLEPNFWLQGPLFCDCYSPYDDISDGRFHDRHSYERVYPNNFDLRISKNYLVWREMACRERR